MSSLENLDPIVQHHIVNTLGWRELRELQELSIQPILEGNHCLLLAPTAGGKTEAAILPVLSRICSENWNPLSTLYLCPLKALLNNLGPRLEHYARMVGRESAVWHGDVPTSVKKSIRNEPPDILMTTPESLEVMLISTNPEGREMLRSVRAVIVDEIHAFAGDDRGWHLLALLERVGRLAGREIQRIGLSATVGNPEQLLDWLAGHCEGTRSVTQPPVSAGAQAAVMVDYVGSLQNAAIVISRLHRGEKRLVFCDSRSQVEELAGLLRAQEVQTYVSHSSLSAEERRTAEQAFAEGSDCVIVATSTLELGIDVGDLDRVIQVDAPDTVASFLQRLGRTGRRPGTHRNCLFLATTSNALLRACAVVDLWSSGYVEPVEAPPMPLHILAQQIMALCLQLQGLGIQDWQRWLGRLPPFRALTESEWRAILDHLLEQHILFTDGVRLSLGDRAERDYGRRNFLELLSVFTSDPLLSVLHGRKLLGEVDPISLVRRPSDDAIILSLGGRSWRIQSVDWKARQVLVEPATVQGRSTWMGSRRGVSYVVARRIHRLLTRDDPSEHWSDRTRQHMVTLRAEYGFLRADANVLVAQAGQDGLAWFTCAGNAVNAVLADALERTGVEVVQTDDLRIVIAGLAGAIPLDHALRNLTPENVIQEFHAPQAMLDGLKFSECLPPALAQQVVRARIADREEIELSLNRDRILTTLS